METLATQIQEEVCFNLPGKTLYSHKTMHSGRMRTVRCSGRLGGGAGVCPGGVHPPPRGQTHVKTVVNVIQEKI